MCNGSEIIKPESHCIHPWGVPDMKRYAFAAAAALSIAVPSVSQATTINITAYTQPLGTKNGTLTLAPSFLNGQAVAFGEFSMTGVNVSASNAPVSYLTYCVDLLHGLSVPGLYDIMPLTSLYNYNATKALNLTKLLANTNATTADESAAIQLAVWEIVFETSASADVTGGMFSMASGDSMAARTLANSYLSQLGGWTTNGRTALLLYSETNQSQVFLTAVPETATWGMMIVGFGVVGAAMRRRAKVSYRLA
jgi:hypothetical protein